MTHIVRMLTRRIFFIFFLGVRETGAVWVGHGVFHLYWSNRACTLFRSVLFIFNYYYYYYYDVLIRMTIKLNHNNIERQLYQHETTLHVLFWIGRRR